MEKVKYLFLPLLLFAFLQFSAQNNKKIKKMSDHDIIKKYEKLNDKSTDIKRLLAESYFKTERFNEAEDYYSELVFSNDRTADDVYNYASVLAANEEYEEFEKWMDVYSRMNGTDSRAKLYTENKGFYKILLEDKEQFRIKNIDMNSESQDFGAAYFKDKIVFTSSRKKMSFIQKIWADNKLPYLDMYTADNVRGKLENIKPFEKIFNNKYHDGPASFSEKGDMTAYTRNNYEGKSPDELVKLQIYISYLNNKEEWSEPKGLHFNNYNYSVKHPSLSADGRTLYFSSDMPGGYGAFDLYMCYREQDSTWTDPINLGDKINTSGDEVFPFIHESGMFFFSSDGWLTLGGLDIFYSKLENGNFLDAKNPGVPLNSSRDDFAFVLDKKMKRGFFSSNRPSGKGSYDIYSIRLLKAFEFDVFIKGRVFDKNNKALPNAIVSLYDSEGNIVEMNYTDQFGKYEYKVAPGHVYKLETAKPKYLPDTGRINTGTKERVYLKDFILEELPKFVMFCNINDKKTNDPLSGVKVFVSDNRKSSQTELFTSDKGECIYKLTGYDLKDSLNLTVTIFKQGYAPEVLNIEKFLNSYGDIKKTVKLQKIEIGEDLGKILGINPVYFDYDKSNIRPDAAQELDKIVKIMNEYPDMVIELSSHTDCRGSSIYNLKLSDRRAKASAHYIKTRITNPTRIYGDGYGESKLINDCSCEGSNRSDCTEEEHQENRRTEFKIIRI